MRRKIAFTLILSVLLASVHCIGSTITKVKASDSIDISKVYGVAMLWNSSMSINDVAVSEGGSYMAVVNTTGLYYFMVNNLNPQWWEHPPEYFNSVAISADGEYVVVGTQGGNIYYFNNSRARIGNTGSPTWGSVDLYGPVDRGTIDISNDGEYVAVGGTGDSIFYFAGCTGRSGSDQNPTWQFSPLDIEIITVDMAQDGSYIAAGGPHWYLPLGQVFFKDANGTTVWFATTDSGVREIVIADDGSSVVAVDGNKLYYWANATNLSGDSNATWSKPRPLGLASGFRCVAMSADGSNVIAGTDSFDSLHFWVNATNGQENQTETWIKAENVNIHDVTMRDSGIIAAFGLVGEPIHYPKALFFKSDGSIFAEFDLTSRTLFLSMSRDGRFVAMGGDGPLTFYMFEVLEDFTLPSIEYVHQQPTEESVFPDDKVMVYANVTDDESGIKNVILNYTNGNGTWIIQNMTNLEGNQWNSTIPAFDYCTYVNYTIVAEDEVSNRIALEEVSGSQNQYHVIPELSSFIVLPLFVLTALLTIIAKKRKRK